MCFYCSFAGIELFRTVFADTDYCSQLQTCNRALVLFALHLRSQAPNKCTAMVQVVTVVAVTVVVDHCLDVGADSMAGCGAAVRPVGQRTRSVWYSFERPATVRAPYTSQRPFQVDPSCLQ